MFLKCSYFFSFQSPWFCFGFTMNSLDLQKKARMLMRSWMLNKLAPKQRQDSHSVLSWIGSSLKWKIFWNNCLYQTITLSSTLLDTFTGKEILEMQTDVENLTATCCESFVLFWWLLRKKSYIPLKTLFYCWSFFHVMNSQVKEEYEREIKQGKHLPPLFLIL